MKRVVLIAALLAATLAAQPGWAAHKSHAVRRHCGPSSATEAEAGIRYMTDLMVVSSVCGDTVYAEFRLRNRDAIIAYQKALIRRFRGTAGFDHWNTVLANEVSQRQASVPPALFCQQSQPLLKQASALDARGFRAYAAAQAAAAAPTATCRK
ncbi:MAG TPA: hypothetical protein VND95_16505 [Stellaceae bacterium]|nr:hypothetical protein [Stellaceae bacterium]